MIVKMNAFIKFTSCFAPLALAAVAFGCTSSTQSGELKNSSVTISPSATPQTEMQIADDDEEQIIVEGLKQENARDAKEKQKKNTQNTIYILEGNFPLKQIPKVEGVDVKFITQAEIETKKQSEIVYYEFRDFRGKDSKVEFL